MNFFKESVTTASYQSLTRQFKYAAQKNNEHSASGMVQLLPCAGGMFWVLLLSLAVLARSLSYVIDFTSSSFNKLFSEVMALILLRTACFSRSSLRVLRGVLVITEYSQSSEGGTSNHGVVAKF